MRGAWETYYEYIPELHTEFEITASNRQIEISIVGCDVVAHVISAGVLSDTYRGKQCELFTKKRWYHEFYASSFYKGGAFLIPESPNHNLYLQKGSNPYDII